MSTATNESAAPSGGFSYTLVVDCGIGYANSNKERSQCGKREKKTLAFSKGVILNSDKNWDKMDKNREFWAVWDQAFRGSCTSNSSI